MRWLAGDDPMHRWDVFSMQMDERGEEATGVDVDVDPSYIIDRHSLSPAPASAFFYFFFILLFFQLRQLHLNNPRLLSHRTPHISKTHFHLPLTTMATRFATDNPPTTAPSHDSAVTAETSIPSHPAPKDPASTSSGTATSAEGRTDAGASRAIDSTNSWKPSFERRQSWNKEDQKRALQMTGIDSVKTGPGFSERA
ncbi:hypothetical protein HJFPF1_09376 [Paramyrothecium foliicola]|nr:hypothetical protein HJFPF1_09376 [Paramyrothecium foliicola]